MTKCEYCGKEIGLLAVKYTWLDKKNDRAMHDECYEKYMSESPEKRKQIYEEKRIQKEDTKPLEKMIKSKILGGVLIGFAIFFTLFALYSEITFGSGFVSMYFVILLILSYISGIELIRIKRGGTYHKLILIVGIILLALYAIMIISTLIVVLAFK